MKALADRLAEAFAEWLHQRVRREWYAPDEHLTAEDLVKESFRGIRPAFGYPACPDHSEKAKLFELLGADATGLALTESFAMTPAAAVSAASTCTARRRSTSPSAGSADDQLADYAERKGGTGRGRRTLARAEPLRSREVGPGGRLSWRVRAPFVAPQTFVCGPH